MTGGQFSCTTPSGASVSSGFLNTIEIPMDICRVAVAAGASFAARCSVYQEDLPRVLGDAVVFEGFSVVDIWGACTGYYSRRNHLSPRDIEEGMSKLPSFGGPVVPNIRREYGGSYREARSAAGAGEPEWQRIEAIFPPPVRERREIVLLGAAGDRILSAGGLLAHAAILSGMQVSQKNDYDITVMRGPSVSELILSPQPISYTGVERPDIIVALAREGITRKRQLFAEISSMGRVIFEKGLEIPDTGARTMEIDFKGQGIKKTERALAALSVLARTGDPITSQMLDQALRSSLKGEALQKSLALVERHIS
jgi:Pyruvate/2-oxoacid:ferredoxin oxidoreductase gamma subunit